MVLNRELEVALSKWKTVSELQMEGHNVTRGFLRDLVKEGKLEIKYSYPDGSRVEKFIKAGVWR